MTGWRYELDVGMPGMDVTAYRDEAFKQAWKTYQEADGEDSDKIWELIQVLFLADGILHKLWLEAERRGLKRGATAASTKLVTALVAQSKKELLFADGSKQFVPKELIDMLIEGCMEDVAKEL